MKKTSVILISALVMVALSGCAFAAETTNVEANKAITEIGMLVNSQKYKIAMSKCNAAIQKFPNESFLYYWRGSVYNSMGEKELALQDLNKAISLNPKNEKAYVLRGICKSGLEDKNGALEDYNKAIELNPNDCSAYSMRAMVKLDLGDYDGANEDLDKSNKLMNSK